MPAIVDLERHRKVVAESGARLREAAMEAGLGAGVPTCPRWRARDLVSHQGMVHRWAAAHLRGEADHDPRSSTREAAAATDLFAWYSSGLEALLAAIEAAPDDLRAMVFLRDAPPPRWFWARRQAHETTIHSVDALAARLGRMPRAEEVVLDPLVAADGIDELVCGFLPRGKGKLRFDSPTTIRVVADDTGHAWTMRVDDESNSVTVGEEGDADAVLSGSAAQVYLGLWNRGDEITAEGRDGVLARWRKQARIRWG